MKSKVSQAQQEVWEMKESLYNEIKDLAIDERLQHLRNKVKDLLEGRFKQKRVRSLYH
ncbi:MAG: hypothetical protein WCI71_19330 [Bacteroidota bacterium]